MNQSLPRIAARTACLAFTFLCTAIAPAQSSPPLFPVINSLAVAPNAGTLFVGDITGGGKVDLAYASSYNPQSVGVIVNFGSSSATTVTTNLCAAGSQGPSLVDVNNDK